MGERRNELLHYAVEGLFELLGSLLIIEQVRSSEVFRVVAIVVQFIGRASGEPMVFPFHWD